MTNPYDPSQPPGGSGWNAPPGGGWSAPPQHAPSAPAPGWSPPAPPAQGGWSPPAQGGWGPPPQPAQGAWNAPAAPANPQAAWESAPTGQRSAIDFYFVPPKELEGTPRLAYHALTVLSLPLLLPSALWYFMLFLRFRRFGINVFIGVFTHVFGSIVPYALFGWVGTLFGVPPFWVGVPMTVLFWVPLLLRYLLPRFVAR